MTLKPGLYIVSTPIGNIRDITFRAIETLTNSNIIICEDTRISRKLLEKYQISVPLKVYNDHSDIKDRDLICSHIMQNKVVSLISDAGTPTISDPGYKLVQTILKHKLYFDIIPGVSSPIAALTLSNMPSDKFYFAGFIPKTKLAKEHMFRSLITLNASLIFFESSNRILDSIEVALNIFGDNRIACVTRELTKMHQESNSGTLLELRNRYSKNKIRGEIVLIISGQQIQNNEQNNNKIIELIRLCLSEQLSAKTATKIAHMQFKNQFSKKDVYKIVNNIYIN
ncbi:MAG: 16S rRNA (cytidine(1402)-2'-O)-methyltransferase [Rickettsiaceae bacterium]